MATKRRDMVLGILTYMDRVVLIKQDSPQWRKGKWNFPGGKVEPGETIREAVRREFREETGVDIAGWEDVATISGNNWEVHVFSSESYKLNHVKTAEGEMVWAFDINDLPPSWKLVPHVKWLLHLAHEDNLIKPVCVEGKDLGK